MGRVAKLIMVTQLNNNKHYDMVEENGQINITYGRVGQSTQHTTYPTGRWDSLLKSKIKKGYKDVTELRIEDDYIDFQTIGDDTINQIVAELQALANKSIQRNYTVSSEAVTQKQVEEAQKLLDKLVKLSGQSKKLSVSNFNDILLDIYQVIPRRMRHVADHLWNGSQDTKILITNEQDTLDVMKGQVHVNTVKKDNTVEDKKTILDALGLDIQITSPEDIKTIKKELGQIQDKYCRSYKITNKRTQKRFDEWVEQVKNKECKPFWHGSRSENWWSILDGGLTLRPSNAVITGKMFGYGLYFADKARKSYGYTSCQGSYWARGNASKGFMSLYDVHLGNSYVSKHREHWMGSATEKSLKTQGEFDSLTVLGGADLRNNEFIVYNENQCTIKYLVEVNG